MEWYPTPVSGGRGSVPSVVVVWYSSIYTGTEAWLASKAIGLTVEKPFAPWLGECYGVAGVATVIT